MLSNFISVRPRYELSNELASKNSIEFRLLQKGNTFSRSDITRRITRFGAAFSSIKTRGTEVKDYALSLPEQGLEFTLFKDGISATLEQRMELYQSRAIEVIHEMYADDQKLNRARPQNLIHVSCTGYQAPSAAQAVVAEWGIEGKYSTQVTHAYHMGCYASLPALRIARGFLAAASEKQTVDIIHNEMCSLHFDPGTLEPEQVVVQSLFADGHIKYTMGTDSQVEGFEVLSLFEQILPASGDAMTWAPGPTHFKMTLSRTVQNAFLPYLKNFVSELLNRAQISSDTVPLIYAVHPGGPKIIEGVQGELLLGDEQVIESQSILERCGNMSSATIPHILKEILSNPKRMNGGVIVALAFGPGLTMSGGVFRLCKK